MLKPKHAHIHSKHLLQFCGAHNFRDKFACFKCHAPRQDGFGGFGGFGGGLPENFKPGDWMCPMCSAHNYQNKMACFKCGTPKPGR